MHVWSIGKRGTDSVSYLTTAQPDDECYFLLYGLQETWLSRCQKELLCAIVSHSIKIESSTAFETLASLIIVPFCLAFAFPVAVFLHKRLDTPEHGLE